MATRTTGALIAVAALCTACGTAPFEPGEGQSRCAGLGGVDEDVSGAESMAQLLCGISQRAQQNAWDCLTGGVCDEAVRAVPWMVPDCSADPVVCDAELESWELCTDEREYIDCAVRQVERIRLCWELTCDPGECAREVHALEEVCGPPPASVVERFVRP